MDVQTIAERAQLPLRKVRYVLEQRVLSGLRGKPQLHLAGRPRTFTPLEGFLIATAALLLEGGLRRRTVSAVMDRLAHMPWPPPLAEPRRRTSRAEGEAGTAVKALFLSQTRARLFIGDGANLRVQVDGPLSGWLEPHQFLPLSERYRPRLVVELDLELLRNEFRRTE
jgi:hypothetical protein